MTEGVEFIFYGGISQRSIGFRREDDAPEYHRGLNWVGISLPSECTGGLNTHYILP